jgi:hypothetical protein
MNSLDSGTGLNSFFVTAASQTRLKKVLFRVGQHWNPERNSQEKPGRGIYCCLEQGRWLSQPAVEIPSFMFVENMLKVFFVCHK